MQIGAAKSRRIRFVPMPRSAINDFGMRLSLVHLHPAPRPPRNQATFKDLFERSGFVSDNIFDWITRKKALLRAEGDEGRGSPSNAIGMTPRGHTAGGVAPEQGQAESDARSWAAIVGAGERSRAGKEGSAGGRATTGDNRSSGSPEGQQRAAADGINGRHWQTKGERQKDGEEEGRDSGGRGRRDRAGAGLLADSSGDSAQACHDGRDGGAGGGGASGRGGSKRKKTRQDGDTAACFPSDGELRRPRSEPLAEVNEEVLLCRSWCSGCFGFVRVLASTVVHRVGCCSSRCGRLGSKMVLLCALFQSMSVSPVLAT